MDHPLPPADVPMPREDEYSRIAHAQLVEKARQGRIDLYFLGDSITRRWGCTDPMYADLLAHWRGCFHGWHAGNFGWGGDTTRNILWRLDHAELEGVHPKVIVLLAGTNNLSEGASAEDVVRGVRAIVGRCRTLAPGARTVLMGVFPRNDIDAAARIAEINAQLAELADGRTLRFLDIGDRLAGEGGLLRAGMSDDGLHFNLPGYRAWFSALEPVLGEWLGPRDAVDLAPPATGDPKLAPR